MAVPPSGKKLSLTYSLADQSSARTKSLGIFNVAIDLIEVLARRPELEKLTVLSNRLLEPVFVPPPGVTMDWHDRAADSSLGRMAWDQLGAYTAARRSGNEWLFLPKGFASFLRRPPVRLATFVHDVMQDHYDRTYPDAVGGFEAAYFRASFHASLRHSNVIFTPTEFVRREIARVAKERDIEIPGVVCCGEGFDRPASAPAEERRDIVVLSSRFPHKLTRTAIDFLSRWSGAPSLKEKIHWIGSFPTNTELPARDGWVRHATLPEPEFRALMARARVVIFFSDYEGFGRPPVEAVLAGACPVFSDIPATREVMGTCGLAFDNRSAESFTRALDQALKVSPEQLRAWADELILRHNWTAVADRILGSLSACGKDSPEKVSPSPL